MSADLGQRHQFVNRTDGSYLQSDGMRASCDVRGSGPAKQVEPRSFIDSDNKIDRVR